MHSFILEMHTELNAHYLWILLKEVYKSCSSGAIRAVLNFCNINDDIIKGIMY